MEFGAAGVSLGAERLKNHSLILPKPGLVMNVIGRPHGETPQSRNHLGGHPSPASEHIPLKMPFCLFGRAALKGESM